MRFISAHQTVVVVAFLLTINAPAVSATVAAGTQAETVEQQIERTRAAFARKDYGEAKKALKRALKLKKDSSEACLLMARIHRIEGKDGDAVKYVKKAIASNAGNCEAQTLYARLLLEASKFPQARKQLTIALAITPKHPNGQTILGRLAADSGLCLPWLGRGRDHRGAAGSAGNRGIETSDNAPGPQHRVARR